MFKRILIANRGEIACRIIKTAKRMGIKTIAIFTEQDANSLHVQKADEAYLLEGTYLNQKEILALAILSKAEAIHPGYGFLSENSSFAKACEEQGVVFIGPGSKAIDLMGSKQLSKQYLEKTKVPLTPGYHGSIQEESHLLKEANKIGYPLLIKAAAGGGGKGMREVLQEKDFLENLEAAKREAKASFGDEKVILEKRISNPRHIEVQIIRDNYGNALHLFERDCSIQRRHQKIIEEAPAINLDPAIREKITQAAIRVAEAIDYKNAGTIEFLLDDQNNFYFMEMNTRLQVEHPVTECITDIDLVELQLRVADSQVLPLKQNDINFKGHAIECRIYAEDPKNNFLPSCGEILWLKEPLGDGIRIDTGVQEGAVITPYYDPMIAKLIAFGASREEAIRLMAEALNNYRIAGISTNIEFLAKIVNSKAFIEEDLSTDFLVKNEILFESYPSIDAVLLASAYDYLSIKIPKDFLGWQPNLQSFWYESYMINDKLYKAKISPLSLNSYLAIIDDKTFKVVVDKKQDTYFIRIDKHQKQIHFYEAEGCLYIYDGSSTVKIKRFVTEARETLAEISNKILAPMTATVIKMFKNKNEAISLGEPLCILEAMKMEHIIKAPFVGTVAEVFYKPGDQVAAGEILLELAESENET